MIEFYNYKFKNLQTLETKTIRASTLIDALNQLSKDWFGGKKVIDYVNNSSGQITLLTTGSGNVIGKIFWDGDC